MGPGQLGPCCGGLIDDSFHTDISDCHEMALTKQIIRMVLFIHGLLNIAQGFYCIFRPVAWAETAGEGFVGAPSKAIQSIGTYYILRTSYLLQICPWARCKYSL